MTALHQALHAFWSQFAYGGAAIPAYLSGQVPEDATFPYITYEVADGALYGGTILSATVWCTGGNAQRAAILDDIAKALPSGGKLLRYAGGVAMLYRSEGSFQSYAPTQAAEHVLGGVTRYEAHNYN